MKRELKLVLAALLGFSTACSTVKNTPAKGEQPASEGITAADSAAFERRVIVMYGVRRPIPKKVVADSVAREELEPILEQPKDDLPVVPTNKK